MLHDRAETAGAVLCVLDLATLAMATAVAYRLRATLDPAFPDMSDYLPLFGLMGSLWLVLLYHFGLYDEPRGGRTRDDLLGITKVSLCGFLTSGALIFGLKLHFVSRLLIGIYSILSFAFLVCERTLTRFAVARTSISERFVLVLGDGPHADAIRQALALDSEWGLRLVAPPRNLSLNDARDGIAAVLSAFLTSTVVDEVIFAVSPSDVARLDDCLLACECVGVRAHLSLTVAEMRTAKALSTNFHGIPLLTFTTTPVSTHKLIVKRAFDVAASAVLLVVLAPLFALIVAAIKLTSPGPVLFRQTRSGANGRPFQMYKFRSMCAEAEALQAQLAGANEMSGPVFKIKRDPRLTPIGGWLRRTSLDELPQLWNVLRGEMSLVGPRPPVPAEVVQYQRWQRRRLSMKPGLTCLWQVSGRSDINDFERWMHLDLEYIDNWSLTLDLWILAKTFPAVISGRGAA